MKSKVTPLIFIPGVFGSMSDVILPGTGDWSFGVAKVAYGPFIEMLELMGYRLNEDLFISFYDWRKSCSDSAKYYLYKKIQLIKKLTFTKKINIVCHSMGGLVARSYVQSDYYENDVNKIILMATPNLGAVANFSYWTGGEMPKTAITDYSFVKIYMKAYLNIIKLLYPKNPIQGIQETFPGLSNLLPSEQYGDYIYTKYPSGIKNYISQDQMYTQNNYLNELNQNVAIINERNIDITVIAAIGEPTVNSLQVIPTCSQKEWIDGKIVNSTVFTNGDGSTTQKSVFFIDGDKYTVIGTHIDMLYKSEPILRKKLLGKEN